MNNYVISVNFTLFESEVQRYWRSVEFSVQFHTSGIHRFVYVIHYCITSYSISINLHLYQVIENPWLILHTYFISTQVYLGNGHWNTCTYCYCFMLGWCGRSWEFVYSDNSHSCQAVSWKSYIFWFLIVIVVIIVKLEDIQRM